MEEQRIRVSIKQHFELWKEVEASDIVLQKLNGITNETYKASVPNSDHSPIIFRKFGPSTQNPFLKRESEVKIYERAFQKGLGPKIYYYDQEFRLEEYIESQVLPMELMLVKGYREEVAFALNKFHQLSLQQESFPKIPIIWRIFVDGMDKIISDCSVKLSQYISTEKQKQLADLIKAWISKEELTLLAGYLKLLEKDGIVFSHNDPLSYNILIEKQSGKIILIDYEYAGYNYPVYDLAYYITESYFNYEVKQWPYFSLTPLAEADREMRFIEAYVISQDLALAQFREGLEQLRQLPKYRPIIQHSQFIAKLRNHLI